MCIFKPKSTTKPDIPILGMPSTEVRKEISKLGLTLMCPGLMDAGQDYYYTTHEGWGRVFYYIYLDFPMPAAIAARMDCEDFALLLKGLVSAIFGLNYFDFDIGTMPQGTHGFNLGRDELGHFLWEPQPRFGISEPFQIGDSHQYFPKYTLL